MGRFSDYAKDVEKRRRQIDDKARGKSDAHATSDAHMRQIAYKNNMLWDGVKFKSDKYYGIDFMDRKQDEKAKKLTKLYAKKPKFFRGV